MAKAVMFTMSFLLLSAILLGLGFLIFEISESTEQRATEFAINNRINDLSTSISKGLADIFISESGINISVVDNTISIQEVVPNPMLENYSTAIDNFKLFVEEREQYATIDNTDISETRLLINPVDSIFYNDNSGSDEDKRYIENFVNVENITFEVYRSDIPVEDIFWQELIPGETEVTAIFRNDTHTISETQYVDLVGDGDDDEFRVTFYPGETFDDDIDFEVRDGNLLKIFDLRYNTTINITFTYEDAELIKIFMDNSVTIAVPEFNISKVTSPRIV